MGIHSVWKIYCTLPRILGYNKFISYCCGLKFLEKVWLRLRIGNNVTRNFKEVTFVLKFFLLDISLSNHSYLKCWEHSGSRFLNLLNPWIRHPDGYGRRDCSETVVLLSGAGIGTCGPLPPFYRRRKVRDHLVWEHDWHDILEHVPQYFTFWANLHSLQLKSKALSINIFRFFRINKRDGYVLSVFFTTNGVRKCRSGDHCAPLLY